MYVTANAHYTENEAELTVTVLQQKSTSPFMIHIAGTSFLHINFDQAQRLHVQLTAALYEYTTELYKHDEKTS